MPSAAARGRSSPPMPAIEGSVSGKCSPTSPAEAAPRSASANAWQTASPSEWPARPGAPSNSTPPSSSGRSGSNRWTSNPRPDRRGNIVRLLYHRIDGGIGPGHQAFGPPEVLLGGDLEVPLLAGDPQDHVADGLHQHRIIGGVHPGLRCH